MIVAECRALFGDRRVEILGTDIAREQIARAREGLYNQFEIQRGLPMQMLVRYFRKEPPHWRVVDTLRDRVQFREWNLLSDLRPLGRFDVVFCRNVLIYFDQPTSSAKVPVPPPPTIGQSSPCWRNCSTVRRVDSVAASISCCLSSGVRRCCALPW